MDCTKTAGSAVKPSTFKEFSDTCSTLGEDNVMKILAAMKESKAIQDQKVKEFIINKTTSKFDLDSNFFRKKRVTYTITHNSICFAIILFYIRKYLKLSYKNICRDLKIREKNSVTFYLNKLNFNSKKEDGPYYKNLFEQIDFEIKEFVEKTIKNNNSNGSEA
jgi:hypothetical protein